MTDALGTPRAIARENWTQTPGEWHGEVQGFGGEVSLIFVRAEPGKGPRLHSHPYPETFIVRAGRALYTIGDREIEAGPGEILVVPAGMPHKFRSLGPETLVSVDIHASERFITDWLE
jgi:mannose-6-phosphate isomerase-like protein (cupin superfamily)